MEKNKNAEKINGKNNENEIDGRGECKTKSISIHVHCMQFGYQGIVTRQIRLFYPRHKFFPVFLNLAFPMILANSLTNYVEVQLNFDSLCF
jgi:hypothetical protein